MSYETINCVNHPKVPAVCYTGHVHDPMTSETIIAGWCEPCANRMRYASAMWEVVANLLTPCVGCFGAWLEIYGKQEDAGTRAEKKARAIAEANKIAAKRHTQAKADEHERREEGSR